MANRKLGPLLVNALSRIDEASTMDARAFGAALDHFAGREEADERFPIVAQLRGLKPAEHEPWSEYRGRVSAALDPLRSRLREESGIQATPLIAANALQLSVSRDQIQALSDETDIEFLELDPLVQVVQMDDAVEDVELQAFRAGHGGADGAGVTVAMLDSGIDTQHPELNVAESVSTCGESTGIPGSHGTHCAGSIASQDGFFPGIAPGVRLLNIKVLRADGVGRHTFVTRGIDEALDRGAQVLSMSLGWNHLPTWSDGGHGWSCPDGQCTLCTAVDNAATLDNCVVVVAAGNEHERVAALRPQKWWPSWLDWLFSRLISRPNVDTELGCPGQAREAITVGALTKNTFIPASFSSHGPTAYGTPKPDLSAPGVNITSTVPVPRDENGQVVPNAPRIRRFGRKSGTSMATPIVAGAAALIIQREQAAGRNWTPASIKAELMTNGVVAMTSPIHVVGAGRLSLRAL
jgi:subtilisin family serine protease